MKTVACLNDLRELGIIPLTGEADNLSFRVLCDLTVNGLKVMQETYGATQFQPNWNSSEGAVASCMIAPWAMREIAIVGYALQGKTTIMTSKCVYVIEAGDHLESPEYEDGTWKDIRISRGYKIDGMEWPSCYGEILRVFKGSEHPHVGTRNTHAMSGRVM